MDIKKEFENISQLKCEDNEDIKYLKQSNLSLVLYGAQKSAQKIKSFLDNSDIKVNYVAVDKEYWQPNMKFEDFDVLPIENVLTNNLKINIIITFTANNEIYEKKLMQLNKSKNIQACLFFDINNGFKFDHNFVSESINVLTGLYHYLEDDLSRSIMLKFMESKNWMNTIELLNLNVVNEQQYFPDFLSLTDNETFVDCGAYIGDTIEVFLQKTNNKFNKIFAFEPDLKNAVKCRGNLCEIIHKGGGVNIIEKGVWSEKTILSFSNEGTSSSTISGEGNVKIEVDSIDNVCSGEKITFIKMDVEGAELEALKGAEKQIKANKPKLAICVYHKREDLITIPQYILLLNPEYKLYLRHYGNFGDELVLYAV